MQDRYNYDYVHMQILKYSNKTIIKIRYFLSEKILCMSISKQKKAKIDIWDPVEVCHSFLWNEDVSLHFFFFFKVV